MDSDEAVRLFLHERLAAAFPSVKLYFRPPGNILLSYPCIVYAPQRARPAYAANVPYVIGMQYQVTLMSLLPGTDRRPMFHLPGVVMISNTSYVHTDVVHDVFILSVNCIT